MKIIDINPFIRFAAKIDYKNAGNFVTVRDCRIFYILFGNCDLLIDNKTFSLDKNSLFYCSSGSQYMINAENGVSIIAINFDLSQNNSSRINAFSPSKQSLSDDQIIHENISDSDYLNSYLCLENGIDFLDRINLIIDEFSEKNNYYMETVCCLLKMILTELHISGRNTRTKSEKPLKTVINFIQNNFAQQITNKKLAEIAGYHEYYLNRIFIQRTGQSMHKYIMNMRLTEAQRLILNTNLPLTSIADMTGFNNYTHFSEYFKKRFDAAPSKYRKLHKENI